MSRRLLESGDALLIEDGSSRLLEVVDASVSTEEARFGGGPISARDLDRMKWERELERLLREDEELLCLL